MKEKIKSFIKTLTILVMLSVIWQLLEYYIYGEVQPRVVDTIMMLFFAPFIDSAINRR